MTGCKELIKTFFFEFVQLFFPDLAAKLDREVIEFLDKQVFTDVTEGERHEADLVAKVRLNGEPSFFLFHVEPQSSARNEFPRRMFSYFARLHETFGLPVYPVAVLSYDAPKTEAPHGYGVTIDGWQVLAFEYRSLQLNRMSWRDYIRQDNPVSLALAAKMRMEAPERRKVKFECLRLLWTMKLDAARMEMIAGFINSYLKLSRTDEEWLEAEMETVAPENKEKKVLFWTHWHDRGFDEGLEQARQENTARALRVVERNWRRRFGTELPSGIQARVAGLDAAGLDELGDAILDFSQPSDAERWLSPDPG